MQINMQKKMKIAKSTLQNKEKSHKNTLTYCIFQIKVYFIINKPTTHKKNYYRVR